MKLTLTMVGAFVLIPSLALAQQDTTRRDTTTRDTTTTSYPTTTPQDTTQSSAGALARPMNHGLTTDQVKQLQQAINQNGCTVSDTSGTFNRETMRGIQCIRQNKQIQSNNLNDVLRALNLSFTAPDSMLTRNRSRMGQDTSMMHRDTSMSHDTSMMHHDTTSKSQRP